MKGNLFLLIIAILTVSVISAAALGIIKLDSGIDNSGIDNSGIDNSGIDNSGIYVNNTVDLKFITVGDPQIGLDTLDGIERLRQVVNFANKSDIDFVVFEGDMTEDGTVDANNVVRDILKDLHKPYYVVIGNHDLYTSSEIFTSFYGPSEHIEYVNGYQLIFVGMSDKNVRTKLNWSFDFSKTDKNIPTLVFIHGPVVDVPIECLYCRMNKDILEYGHSIKPELEKFTNLIGVYSGHVHHDSNVVIDGIRYVTVNGLVNITVMGVDIAHPSDKVGYTTVHRNKSYYDLVSYI